MFSFQNFKKETGNTTPSQTSTKKLYIFSLIRFELYSQVYQIMKYALVKMYYLIVILFLVDILIIYTIALTISCIMY